MCPDACTSRPVQVLFIVSSLRILLAESKDHLDCVESLLCVTSALPISFHVLRESPREYDSNGANCYQHHWEVGKEAGTVEVTFKECEEKAREGHAEGHHYSSDFLACCPLHCLTLFSEALRELRGVDLVKPGYLLVEDGFKIANLRLHADSLGCDKQE